MLSLITLITSEYHSQQGQNKTKNNTKLTLGPTTQHFYYGSPQVRKYFFSREMKI